MHICWSAEIAQVELGDIPFAVDRLNTHALIFTANLDMRNVPIPFSKIAELLTVHSSGD